MENGKFFGQFQGSETSLLSFWENKTYPSLVILRERMWYNVFGRKSNDKKTKKGSQKQCQKDREKITVKNLNEVQFT